MSDLRQAAQQALEALERSETTVQYEGFGMARRDAERKHQAAIDALRAALIEDAMQKFTDVNQELEAALAEPDWHDLYLKEKKRADMWRDKYESVAGAEQRIYPLAEPVQEPVAWIHTMAPFQPKERNFCPRCGKRTNDIHTCTPP